MTSPRTSAYKAVAVYERPFWRERNGGEFIVLDVPDSAVFDTTAPDGHGRLCVLISGPEARALRRPRRREHHCGLDGLDAADRRKAVLGPLIPHVGPEVLEPASWHAKSWHLDEFAGGGYIALPNPGTTDGLVPMSSVPIGDIHWAGSETASDHPGYLDGAIGAGGH